MLTLSLGCHANLIPQSVAHEYTGSSSFFPNVLATKGFLVSCFTIPVDSAKANIKIKLALPQQVPGSTPGRRTKVVKLHGLMRQRSRRLGNGIKIRRFEDPKIRNNIDQRQTRRDSLSDRWLHLRVSLGIPQIIQMGQKPGRHLSGSRPKLNSSISPCCRTQARENFTYSRLAGNLSNRPVT